MHIDGTITNRLLKVIWMALFLGYVAWFVYRYRDREAPRMDHLPLIQFGGPWTLFSKRFWRGRDIVLKKGSQGYFILGIAVFGALYLLFDLVS